MDPNTKQLIKYNILILSACQNRLNGVMHARVRALLHEPGLAANPGQVASRGPPFSSQTLVQLQNVNAP